MLTLQRSMLVSFSDGTGVDAYTMNLMTGAGVCLFALVLGVWMMRSSKREKETIGMAKSKLVKANERIAEKVAGAYQKVEDTVVGAYQKVEDTVVGAYQKVEDTVVGTYTKIEDKFVDQYLTKEGETVEQAKQRLKEESGKK